MQNLFDKIQLTTPGTSTFDLSHDLKTTMKMGTLVPILCEDCVPGDKWQISSEALLRMMPMVAPIMHKVDVYTHYWFVSNRILWDGWETFAFGGEQAGTTPRAAPYLNFSGLAGGIAPSSLPNYIGLPASTLGLSVFNRDVNALPFAAYQYIYHWFYRDQNLITQDIEDITLIDGLNPYAEFIGLKRRAWEHDYFTASLPFAQKGAPVEIPLQLTGLTIDTVQPGSLGAGQPKVRNSGTGALIGGVGLNAQGTSGDFDGGGTDAYYDHNNTLQVDSSTAGTLTTINDLRTATAIQKFLEKNMRAGSRYDESLRAIFGVNPRDGRLQKPEYLGGSKSTMAISEVLQTSSTDATTPQGNMSGHGVSVNGGSDCLFDVPEHGWIIGIMSIMPKTSYYSGVPKKFLKLDKYDYVLPDFAHLGEQEVKQIEIAYQGGPDDDDVFGYQPRYMEYRTIPSRINGEMADSLDYWHLGRKIDQGSPVPLNEEFITCVPDNRIFAVTADVDNIVAHIFFQIKANRPLPMFGTPGGI